MGRGGHDGGVRIMMSDRVGSMTSVGSRVGFRGMKGAGVGGGEKRWITMSVVRGMDFTR